MDGAERPRCHWATAAPDYVSYHDDEWGTVLHGDAQLFERLSLEAFQSGLSWLIISRKRPAFRAAFEQFDLATVADFGDADVDRLLSDAGIVRNRAKITATIANARAVLDAVPEGLDALLWSFAAGRAPTTADARRGRGHLARVHGDGQGAQETGLPLRRTDHGLRPHAGHRNGG